MNKVFSMIGLATRAGKTVAGEFSVEKAVKQRRHGWLLSQRKLQIIQRNCFLTSANIIRFHVLFTEVSRN